MPTLQQMSDDGDRIMVHCEAHGCNHAWPLDFAAAIRSFGPGFDIVESRRRFLHRLVCSKCGARNPSIIISSKDAHKASGMGANWGTLPPKNAP